MNLKDQDGLYRPWVPVALIFVGIIYFWLVIAVIFPAIDRMFGK